MGDNMKVNEKRIIVTGAGGGIGRELTLQLLEKGAYVIGVDINENLLKETKDVCNSEKLSTYVVDISSVDSINNFKNEYFKNNEVVDGIINNAGIIQPFTNFSDLDMKVVDKVMNVNFYGPLRLIKVFMPELLKRDSAHIVNVSSMGGFFPFPSQTIYGASKAALKLFTEGLYAELSNTNIKVTVVFPGAIATDIAKNSNVEMISSGDTSNYKMTSAKKAAYEIIEGMQKDKFQIFVGSDSKMMNMMYKFNPKGAINFINKKMQSLKK
jgi:short-subunit dehydrogenase